MIRPRPTALLVLAAAVASGCSPGNTEGGGARPEFYWTIVNNSDKPIFTVLQQGDRATGVIEPGDPELPEGNFSAVIPAGEDVQFQEGRAVAGDTAPGGCFSGQDRWVVRSRSGDTEGFRVRSPVEGIVEDLEVLWYVSGGTCTDQDELIWEYDGDPTATT